MRYLSSKDWIYNLQHRLSKNCRLPTILSNILVCLFIGMKMHRFSNWFSFHLYSLSFNCTWYFAQSILIIVTEHCSPFFINIITIFYILSLKQSISIPDLHMQLLLLYSHINVEELIMFLSFVSHWKWPIHCLQWIDNEEKIDFLPLSCEKPYPCNICKHGTLL